LKSYKLLVLDIDGTLINGEGTISPRDCEALAAAQRAGIKVALSTGRVASSCLMIARKLGLDGMHITFDGALVSNPETGEEVYAQPIAPDCVQQIIEFVQHNRINVDLFSSTQYFVERESWVSDVRRRFFGVESSVVDITRLPSIERIIKATLVVRSAEEKAKASQFHQYFKDRLHFSWTKTPAYPDVDFINIVDPGVSKGRALEALTSHLGIEMAEVVAMGDGANDIPILSRAGLAIAMADAPQSLKEVADYVTLDVNHSGVAVAISEFLS
jgi:hypothetical protein